MLAARHDDDDDDDDRFSNSKRKEIVSKSTFKSLRFYDFTKVFNSIY